MRKANNLYLIIILSILTNSAIYSKDLKKQTAEESSPVSFYDNIKIGANTGYGITFPTGNLKGSGKQDFNLGESYFIGINFGYSLFNSETSTGMILFETDYSMKEMIKTNVVLNENTHTSIGMEFTDFMLGYLGTYRAFYYEAGFFYGLKTWTWYQKYAIAGAVTETALYDDKENWCSSIYGMYIGLGAKLNITQGLDMMIGIRSSFSFAYGYTHEDKIRPNAVLLNLGFQKKMF